MQSTINLFWYLYNNLPPLFPEEVTLDMKNELENLANQPGLSVEGVEDKMVNYGYEIWPWSQAYNFFLEIAQEQLGDHFLLPQLSEGLQVKYLNFKGYGGTLADLQTGRPAIIFTPEERAELSEKLVDVRLQLRDYVRRDLTGMNQEKYFEKIEEYEELLKKIESNLNSLRDLVRNEENPVLISEINSKIKNFEHGLCFLGTEIDHEAIRQAKDFFAGRKIELSRLSGVNIPMQINFFNS